MNQSTITLHERSKAITLRERMFKIQQRELLISNTRFKYCNCNSNNYFHYHDDEEEEQLLNSTTTITTDDDNRSSSSIIMHVKKQYYEKRMILPISIQLNDLSVLLGGLDMEWNDFSTIFNSTQRFRILLSIERNVPIDQVISSGAVLYFVQFLDLNQIQKYFNIIDFNNNNINSDNENNSSVNNIKKKKLNITLNNVYQLQYEATWAITNIASGTNEHTKYDNNVLPLLVNLLENDCENDDLTQQIIWALGNISGDSILLRDLVLNQNLMPKLLKIIESSINSNIKLLQNATWTLSNLLRGKPSPPTDIARSTLPTLAKLLNVVDDEVLSDTCWAFSFISGGSIQAVIESGITSQLVKLLEHSNHNILVPVLRTIGNLVTGNDYQTDLVLKCGVLNAIIPLINHSKRQIRKESLWTLSNITMGNKDQIQMVIDANIIPIIIKLIESGVQSNEIIREALWVLANLCGGCNNTHLEYAINNQFIRIFGNYGLVSRDPKIVELSLAGIRDILEAKVLTDLVNQEIKSYIEKIVELQENGQTNQIKKMATQIVEDNLEAISLEKEEEME